MKLTISGIRIKLHYSVVLIAGLVAFGAINFYYALTFPVINVADFVLVGLLSGVGVLASILLHELMHSLVAQRHGMHIPEIELYLYGGVSKLEEEPKTPGIEAKVAAAGPLTSLTLGGGLLGLLLLPLALPFFLGATILYLAISNIGLGLFNLLPAYPMDGGRLLRAWLWKRRDDMLAATKSAAKAGRVVGAIIMGLGVVQTFLFGLFGGLWFFFIGSFIRASARRAYQSTVVENKLKELTAGTLLEAPRVTIPLDITVTRAIQEYFYAYRREYFPVSNAATIIGVVTLDDIQRVPPTEHATTRVYDVMVPLYQLPATVPATTGKDVMALLNDESANPSAVVTVRDEQEGLLGFIGEENVRFALNFEIAALER